jgi:ABC-type transport system involved in Fe-S cluster assembly fused permease/ATPase subunit
VEEIAKELSPFNHRTLRRVAENRNSSCGHQRCRITDSHRFSTVRIAEGGTHNELVARAGRYAELFEMQAGRYR